MGKQNNNTSTKRFFTSLLVLAIILLGIGLYLRQNKATFTSIPATLDVNATVLNKPRAISPFNLINNEGKLMTRDSLKGHWTFMFFGFTHCAHICPTTMMELSQVYKQLESRLSANELPQVLLVSVDPVRDTVSKINTYVKSFDPNFIGATGDKAQIDKLARSVGAVYIKVAKKQQTESKADYNIDHSGAVMLIDPQANLRAFFTMPHNANKLARDFTTIVSQGRV